MHTTQLNRISRLPRSGLYAALFLLLVIVSLYAVGPTDEAYAAANDNHSVAGTIAPGATIPPGGTIPGPLIGQVNVLHLAPFAADVADTGVQICDAGGNPVSDALFYEEETGYQNLPVGSYTWSVALAETDCGDIVLEIPEFRLLDQARLLLIIYGDGNNQPLNYVFAIVQEGLETTYLPIAYRAAEAPE